MKTIPYDKSKTYGRYYIEPLDFFMEKGHFWSVEKIYEVKFTYAFPDKTPKEIRLVNPVIKINNLGIQTLGQTAPCNCQECKEGREVVKNGWKPDLKDYLDKT